MFQKNPILRLFIGNVISIYTNQIIELDDICKNTTGAHVVCPVVCLDVHIYKKKRYSPEFLYVLCRHIGGENIHKIINVVRGDDCGDIYANHRLRTYY